MSISTTGKPEIFLSFSVTDPGLQVLGHRKSKPKRHLDWLSGSSGLTSAHTQTEVQWSVCVSVPWRNIGRNRPHLMLRVAVRPKIIQSEYRAWYKHRLTKLQYWFARQARCKSIIVACVSVMNDVLSWYKQVRTLCRRHEHSRRERWMTKADWFGLLRQGIAASPRDADRCI